MSRFARVTEEVLRRHKELAVPHHKTGKIGRNALETLFLYECILVHSWASGILEMPFTKLCESYGLEYHNSTRRLKILREKGWISQTGKKIRPLLIHRQADKDLNSKSVIVTSSDKTSVTVTPVIEGKGVTITPENCNSYTKTNGKGVTVTPENAATSNEISGSGDAKTFKDLKSDLETTSSSDDDGHLSQFSIKECLRWIELRLAAGEKLETPHRLAWWAYQKGEMDAFISAMLYPEQLTVEQTVEYDDAPSSGNLTEKEFDNALKLLIETESEGFDVSDWEKFYTPEDWARLNEEAKNYK